MPRLALFSTIGLLLSGVLGSPVQPEAEARGRAAVNPLCAIVTAAVTKLHQQVGATSYCSSYLSITTPATVTSTVTVSGAVQTITSGSPTFPANNPCFTGSTPAKRDTPVDRHVPASNARLAAPESPPVHAEQVRAVKAPAAKPACFSAYNAAPLISSACKCLSIPSPTTPLTVVTATAPPVVVHVRPESSNFVVRDSSTNLYAVAASPDQLDNTSFHFTATSPAAAYQFSLESTCALRFNVVGTHIFLDAPGGNVVAESQSYPDEDQIAANIDKATGIMTFSGINSQSTWYSCLFYNLVWEMFLDPGLASSEGVPCHNVIAEVV